VSDPFICQDFWQIYFVVTQKDGVEESDQNSLSSSWGILSAESDTGMLTDCMVLMSAKSLLRCWLRHSTALLDRLHMFLPDVYCYTHTLSYTCPQSLS
jgi:hypothetical protein